MWLSRYFVYFIIFSFMGWIYETIYCTIHSKGWENRGFLYGPICPIYGVGAVAVTALCEAFEEKTGQLPVWWQIFLVAFFGSIVLEYLTSYVLEKLFHAYWWDYSDVPLNIHGRVCLPASLGFGIAGPLVIYGVTPLVKKMTSWMSPVCIELFALLFMAVMAADLTLTISALTHFEMNVKAMENSVNHHMEQFVQAVQEKTKPVGAAFTEEKARFSKERMEDAIRSLGAASSLAVQRIKGFCKEKTDRQNRFDVRQQLHNLIKTHITRRETDKENEEDGI